MKHRIAAVALITALMFTWNGAQALWARFSDADLIEASSLIVVGALVDVISVTNPTDGAKRTVGVIDVDSVLKGDAETKTVRLDLHQPGAPISSSDIIYKVGQKGLWFLRLLVPESAAVYAADHPQRFVPFSEAEPVIKAVRKYLDP